MFKKLIFIVLLFLQSVCSVLHICFIDKQIVWFTLSILSFIAKEDHYLPPESGFGSQFAIQIQ